MSNKDQIIEARKRGMTYQQIADELGYKSTGYISQVCKKNGLDGTSFWKEKRYEEYRTYKAEGHTMNEVASRFGINEATVNRVCKGIAPQKQPVEAKRNQYTNGVFDREANAIRYINERTPQFEYAGNFTGVDGFVDLKCKTCGAVITRSFVSVKHGTASCDECKRREAERAKAEKSKLAEEAKKAKYVQKYKRLFESTIEQFEFPTCERCGNMFIPKRQGVRYCSEECMKRANNALRKDRRIRKLKHIVIDKDITLERLYIRDDGICYICGQRCDWDDYEIRDDGSFVAFDNYPSIDHVKPISKGGVHGWDNVKLACRKCNYEKKDSISPHSA